MQTTAINQSLQSQFLAALKTLKAAVDQSPDEFVYADRSRGVPPWQVAVHAYWWAELYMSDGIETFAAAAIHREENHLWNPIPWENNRMPK